MYADGKRQPSFQIRMFFMITFYQRQKIVIGYTRGWFKNRSTVEQS